MHESFRDGFEKVALGQKSVQRAFDAVGARVGDALHSGKPLAVKAKNSLYKRVDKVQRHVDKVQRRADKATPAIVNVPKRAPAPQVATPQAESTQWVNIPKQKYLNDRAEEQAKHVAQQAQEQAAHTKDYGHLPAIAAGVGGVSLGYAASN